MCFCSLNAHEAHKGVKLNGPTVFKVGWNTRGINTADINNDGLLDIAVLNNDKARIDFFFQKKDKDKQPDRVTSIRKNKWEPILEDHPFVPASLITGESMISLTLGDLNNDNITDLAYLYKDGNLNIHIQSSNGSWGEVQKIRDLPLLSWHDSLKILDINNDNKNDLILLGEGVLMVWFQTESGSLEQDQEYFLTSDSPTWSNFVDINDDKLKDFLYYTPNTEEHGLRCRLQTSNRNFGPELQFKLKTRSPINFSGNLLSKDNTGFVSVNNKTKEIEFFELNHSEKPNSPFEFQPKIYATGLDVKSASNYTFTDINNDSRKDVIVTDQNTANITIYQQDENGEFLHSTKHPSLRGIQSIVSGDFMHTGNNELLIVSEKEKIAGISTLNKKNELSFPKPLELKGGPLYAQSADLNNDGYPEVIIIEKDERIYNIQIFEWNTKENNFDVKTVALAKLKRAPNSLFTFDLNQNGRLDIIVNLPKDSSILLVQDEDGSFKEVAKDSPIKKSLFNELSADAYCSIDINNDKKHELLIRGEGFFRAVTMTPSNEIKILGQYNTKNGDSAISSPIITKAFNNKENIFFYDPVEATFQFLQKKSSDYEYNQTLETNGLSLLQSSIELDKDKNSRILLFGQEQFWTIIPNADHWSLNRKFTFETNLKDISPTFTHTIDFDNDGQSELILLDAVSHMLEILKFSKQSNSWESIMHFFVFDENLHYEGRTGAPFEPREIISGDFNNDSKVDFALLVHDRILIYSQD